MNKNKILSGGGKNLTGGGKWGWWGREVGGEGEGSGVKGGGKWGERGREVRVGYPPVHPLVDVQMTINCCKNTVSLINNLSGKYSMTYICYLRDEAYQILCYDHNFPKGEMCQVECFKRIIVCWWVAWAVNFSFGHNVHGHEGGTIDTGCLEGEGAQVAAK